MRNVKEIQFAETVHTRPAHPKRKRHVIIPLSQWKWVLNISEHDDWSKNNAVQSRSRVNNFFMLLTPEDVGTVGVEAPKPYVESWIPMDKRPDDTTMSCHSSAAWTVPKFPLRPFTKLSLELWCTVISDDIVAEPVVAGGVDRILHFSM